MISNYVFADLELFLLLFFGLIALIWYLARLMGLPKYWNGKVVSDSKTSILFSLYTAGHSLMNIKSGNLEKISYRSYMTHAAKTNAGFAYMETEAILYILELDFNTNAHIIGIGNQFNMERSVIFSNLAGYHMEKVDLEGDFPNYFDLFTAKGQQTKVRYVLDPSAMQAFIDYLQHNFWEIVGDELHVIISKNHKHAANVLLEAEKLVEQIRPALIKTLPGEEPVSHEPGYGSTGNKALPCPICEKPMRPIGSAQGCKAGHGILLHGGELVKLRQGQITIDYKGESVEHADLNCPHCEGTMQINDYIDGGFMIDTCNRCAFRWLDADEVQKVPR